MAATMEPEISEEEAQERAQLAALATKYHLSLMPSRALLGSLGKGITDRMIQRIGDRIYQMATFSLPYFPVALLETYLPNSARSDGEGSTTWLLDTVEKLLSMAPILSAGSDSNCSGLTRYFQSKSQPVFRVVAALMPDLEIVYTPTDSDVGTVTTNLQYALATENGEWHWPKDNTRREIAFDQATVAAVNEQTLTDVMALSDAGRPLSPGWWRQLGQETKAQEVEYALAHPRRVSAQSRRLPTAIKKKKAPRQRRFTIETYVIESILEEKNVSSKEKKIFLVRWIGWEDPTWEPLLLLKDTEALQNWKQARVQ